MLYPYKRSLVKRIIWLCTYIGFICNYYLSRIFFPLSVGFRTTPMDSTGVAHILEHTVLCGSRNYPVRDPFFKMLNRSLATFMNAFTGKYNKFRVRNSFDACHTYTIHMYNYVIGWSTHSAVVFGLIV